MESRLARSIGPERGVEAIRRQKGEESEASGMRDGVKMRAESARMVRTAARRRRRFADYFAIPARVGMGCKEDRMRERERRRLCAALDVEMGPFRRASRAKEPTVALLRAVRYALRIGPEEVGRSAGICRSAVTRLERAEREGRITLRSLGRIAEAMGCKVVYGIVPQRGRTLTSLAEERMWRRILEREG